jgi:hypothetical protein
MIADCNPHLMSGIPPFLHCPNFSSNALCSIAAIVGANGTVKFRDCDP